MEIDWTKLNVILGDEAFVAVLTATDADPARVLVNLTARAGAGSAEARAALALFSGAVAPVVQSPIATPASAQVSAPVVQAPQAAPVSRTRATGRKAASKGPRVEITFCAGNSLVQGPHYAVKVPFSRRWIEAAKAIGRRWDATEELDRVPVSSGPAIVAMIAQVFGEAVVLPEVPAEALAVLAAQAPQVQVSVTFCAGARGCQEAHYVVQVPYSPRWVEEARALEGRYFDRSIKADRIPVRQGRAIVDALRRAFPTHAAFKLPAHLETVAA